MNKKILVIATSQRKGGNSETLADELIKGAKEAGNTVEKVVLYGLNVSPKQDWRVQYLQAV